MSLDLAKAINRNEYYGKKLRWNKYYDLINDRILGIKGSCPTLAVFCQEVYDWQGKQNKLGADGIVGPSTWKAMRRALHDTAFDMVAPVKQKKALVLAPKENSPGKKDATGAFHIGAKAFERIFGLAKTHYFDNGDGVSDSARRREVLDMIRSAPGPLDIIGYFGHGFTSGLSSAKIYSRHLGDLADAIRSNSSTDCKVMLYACSAGAFGGFASQLADRLNPWYAFGLPGRTVYGHTNVGHTFYNPNVTRFPAAEYVVEPGGDHWAKWRQCIRHTDLWARFPFMDEMELQNVLDQLAVAD